MDANGNTSAFQANGWMYGLGYDNTNRLTLVQQNGATIATYGINGKGERVSKTVAGTQTTFVYDESGKLLYEQTGSAGRTYIWADDTPVATMDNGTTVSYVYTDHLGTPRAVVGTTSGGVGTATTGTNSIISGNTVWTWPWVQNPLVERPASGSGGYTLNLRYPGQYYDAEDGLMYNGNRDYLAGDGRYIESDPIGLDGGISTYAYAKSNPYVFKDFDGRSVTCDAYSCTISAGDSLLELGIDYLTVEAIKLQREIENERLQRKQCPRDDSHCEELYQVDTQTCNAITRKRGRMAGEACHRSATERYGACLAGRPIPPLNTWNN